MHERLNEAHLELNHVKFFRDKPLLSSRFQLGDAEDLSDFAEASINVLTMILGIMFLPHYKQ